VVAEQGDWLQVRKNGGEPGWIASWLVSVAEAEPQTPSAVASPPDQQAQQPETGPASPPAVSTEREVFVTVDGSTVWSGPGFETRQVSTLSRGTSLAVVAEQGDWLQVRVNGGEPGWIASWLVASDMAEPPASANEPPAAAQPAAGSSLSGRIIVLDPGHGIDPNRGWATGAVGVTGLVEDGLVLDVSLQAAELLRQAGAAVVLTRGETTVSLRQRVVIAEQAQAHVFVSVHANAYFSPDVSGTETFYFRGNPNDADSRWLATCLQREMLLAFGLPDRGVKHGNFHVIRETTMPAALVEFGFLSNPGDEVLMRTPQFRSAAARAIFFGLEHFFQSR
jgi:N-acetylmuramoyl-L-alanine amidase